ncbi:hypothetical protein GUITHDRAFT_136517 [Guillardia theta CCMP2712]|uniref:Uncharacterized protein n=1 Tax=Guillardia theta (strain CCMP2712) TaxID=905079 RepID=L1JKN1_GUITC|nr:hypothetical protein GUITHDRAFT_136517 [Guillardia theta CCMP2712]EKX48867.1 hypothetical protein GUITHDRAFT_136517 [Guillardia theta CCMP2712]|eukprot:XP_005835847.1 hypothetical protein GUITHDRAFT_136517 [Guillardia theta CCMP2712]
MPPVSPIVNPSFPLPLSAQTSHITRRTRKVDGMSPRVAQLCLAFEPEGNHPGVTQDPLLLINNDHSVHVFAGSENIKTSVEAQDGDQEAAGSCWAVKIDELRIDELDSLMEQELFYPFLSLSVLMQGCDVPVDHAAAAGLELDTSDLPPTRLLLPPQRSTGPPVLLFDIDEAGSCSSPRVSEQYAWLEHFELRASQPDINPTDGEEPDEHLRLRIPLDGQDVTILVSLRGLNGAGREIAVASATMALGREQHVREWLPLEVFSSSLAHVKMRVHVCASYSSVAAGWDEGAREEEEASSKAMLRTSLAALLHDNTNQTSHVKRILSFDEHEDKVFQLTEACQALQSRHETNLQLIERLSEELKRHKSDEDKREGARQEQKEKSKLEEYVKELEMSQKAAAIKERETRIAAEKAERLLAMNEEAHKGRATSLLFEKFVIKLIHAEEMRRVKTCVREHQVISVSGFKERESWNQNDALSTDLDKLKEVQASLLERLQATEEECQISEMEMRSRLEKQFARELSRAVNEAVVSALRRGKQEGKEEEDRKRRQIHLMEESSRLSRLRSLLDDLTRCAADAALVHADMRRQHDEMKGEGDVASTRAGEQTRTQLKAEEEGEVDDEEEEDEEDVGEDDEAGVRRPGLVASHMHAGGFDTL